MARDHAHGTDDDHTHGHDHAHGPHHHALPADAGRDTLRRFALGIGLNLAFVVAEVGFGWWAGSLALLADAGHNFGDVVGLALAWFAGWLATRPASQRFTYGLGGSTILAAVANATLLLVAVGGIMVSAVERLFAPGPVEATVVLWVAALGIVVNAGTALLFMSRRAEDLNVRGAYLHMAADAAVSAAVVVSAIVIRATGQVWIDPAMGLVLAIVILVGTWGLLRDSMRMALAAVPGGVDAEAVRAYLSALPGVVDVHDFHLWAMSTSENALTAHVVIPGGHPGDAFLVDAAKLIDERFGVCHVTLQIETDAHVPCMLETRHAA